MTYGRNYKPAMDKIKIIQEFKNCSATQFDPLIIKTMLKLIDQEKFEDSFSIENRKINSLIKGKN